MGDKLEVGGSRAISPSIWRHICPSIRDLTFIRKPGYSSVFIEIPRDLRLQGASPIATQILNKYKVQGAFLCDFRSESLPVLGDLEKTAVGWWYSPRPGTSGTDSFTYSLILNYQLSEIATITIKI